MEKYFKRTFESLDEIFDFIDSFVKANGVDRDAAYTINLAVEELFTNMVKYSPGNSNDVSIMIQRNNNELAVTFIDPEVEPFDITKTGEVDTTKTLAERKAGGLGIHLIKKMVDQIDYEYTNRQSRITLIKRLES